MRRDDAARLEAAIESFDAKFRALARRHGAETHRYPAIIPRDALERADFFASFPDRAAPVLDGAAFLAPAVCYHAWPLLADSSVEPPVVITARGECFRADEPPERRVPFAMREIVFVDTPRKVATRRKRLVEAARKIATEAGIEATVAPATDLFFGAAAGRAIVQKIKELKLELRAPDGRGGTIAIASFNLHETFFTSRFGIRSGEGGELASGCAAFGLERWAAATKP
ncbi:MAG: hypothetical protein ACRD2J_10235 [Thermoanaerobaculia bacterium]